MEDPNNKAANDSDLEELEKMFTKAKKNIEGDNDKEEDPKKEDSAAAAAAATGDNNEHNLNWEQMKKTFGKEDFDEEARKLFSSFALNIPTIAKAPSNNNDAGTPFTYTKTYNTLDPIWKDPRTGGTVYVGNQMAVSDIKVLNQHNITRIVNCTADMPFYHKKSKNIESFRFDIANWWRKVPYGNIILYNNKYSNRLKKDYTEEKKQLNTTILEFYKPVFDFIDKNMNDGKSILIHCLAGAHRAGTMGISYIMYKSIHNTDDTNNHDNRILLRKDDAIRVAKSCRPVIEPIGSFKDLLIILDNALMSTLQ